MNPRPLLLSVTFLFALSACPGGVNPGSTDSAPTTGSTDSTGSTGAIGPTTGAPTTGPTGGDPTESGTTDGGPSGCFDGWDDLSTMYPNSGPLVDCADVPGGLSVMSSLLRVDGLTIDNGGTPMHPCVDIRCDADYAYIGSNNLPHYDFVQTTPNPLHETPTILQIPLAPTRPSAAAAADDLAALDGCIDAYNQHLAAPNQAPPREPAGLCRAAPTDRSYLRETLASGETATYAKLGCLETTAVTIAGTITVGPNEGGMPDPYGNPFFYMPEVAGEPYLPDDLTMGAALDLCGGHTGMSMHYHGVNQACFERAADGTPAHSYAVAAQAWDVQAMLAGPCTEPSPIVGWSLDGYPIAGPCVCTKRDGETCTEVKRARSAWVHGGLSRWGDDPAEDLQLALEGQACAGDDDCCPGGQNCKLRCASVLVEDDGPAGSTVASRCVLLDYSWCTHQFVDRSTHPGGDDFVYLDRCNGYEGPDGYMYHATASFPYLQACYRGEPTSPPMSMPMMPGGGMNPPKCMPGQMMCCGDHFCGGPETPANCPEDCP